MNEYERGFIDGIKSKVSAELTPTLINVSRTMLEMLKPVLSTALENVLNDNSAITDTDVQPVKHGRWEEITDYERDKMLRDTVAELCEAKRLLKAAVEALNDGSCNKDCRQCENHKSCDYDNRFKWKHTNEVLKLIGEGGDEECQ